MAFSSSSSSYIHMVHRLIEECLIFNMSKEECMETLSWHANINPDITSTVWNELEKENKEFFEVFSKGSHERATEIQKRQRIHRENNRIWNELEKENKEFFEAYTKGSHERATEIQKRPRNPC